MNARVNQWLRRFFVEKKKIDVEVLKRWNIAFAVLLAVQGVALLLLSAVHELPVNVSFLTSDAIQSKLTNQAVTAPAIHQLASINLSYVVGAMLFITALANVLLATVWRRYEASLKQRMNPVRWAETAITASLIVAAASLIAGIYDLASLKLLVVLTVLMAGLGMAVDVLSSSKRIAYGWLVPAGAAVAGAVPWVTVFWYICAAHVFGSASVPVGTYLVAMLGTLHFVFLAVNTHLADMKRARWAEYTYAELWYQCGGFILKSTFAWLVFAFVLHP